MPVTTPPTPPPAPGARALAIGFHALGGLMTAVAVHLASVLATPQWATRDAYARIADLAGRTPMRTVLAGQADDRAAFPYQDPAVAAAFCLYDVARAPVRVTVDVTGRDFVGVSLHGRHGRTVYGLTNRSASNGRIALVVMTQRQFEDAAARDTDDAPVTDLRVVVPEPDGFVEARVLATEPSDVAAARNAAGGLSCSPAPAG